MVIDASVAIKWVIEEPDSERAADLLGRDRLMAPDVLLLECANVLSLKVRGGRIEAEDAVDRLGFISASVPRLIPIAAHVLEAQRLSLLLGQTAYDCLYLAVALAEKAELVTADQRFAAAVEPRFPQALRRL